MILCGHFLVVVDVFIHAKQAVNFYDPPVRVHNSRLRNEEYWA